MATPTPSGSKKPGGSGSTPSHLNQSSPPRSVPSPVTARHPAGKTPINHPTTGSSSGSKTLAGTPMVQNLSQGGNTASPSATMLGTPNALGITDGVTPGMGALTPGLVGSVPPMIPSMSDMGYATNTAKRNEDEERRAKMRKVLQRIGRDKGRVSDEGIARVARRVGFANDITPQGNATAGNSIVIDIKLKDQVAQNVQVAFSTESKVLDEHGARAGKVLLDDLAAPGGVALNAKLDRFAVNLERLASMDRLSTNGVNCFEAVSGVYAALERLYEKEKEAAKALLKSGTQNLDEKAEMEVMCKKSGKPLVNADGKIGIELAYWQDNRHINKKKPSGTEMDIDGKDPAAANEKQDQVFKLRLEVEACPAAMYPSLRISDAWLPDPLEMPAADSAELIPWQDPPQTFTAPNASDPNATASLPDLRFVAKLDPPLIVPSALAFNIHNALGNHAMVSQSHPYAQMALGSTEAPNPSYTATSKQAVLSIKDGAETTVQHFYKLQHARLDTGARIDQLPFTHPRQLVELLPTLRQWAYMGSTLKAIFNKYQDGQENAAPEGADSIEGAVKARLTLDDLLTDADPVPNDSILVDVALSTAPMPSLGLSFPKANGSDVANIIVEVQPNADLTATDREEAFRTGESPKTEDTRKREARLAKALDVCGDVGVWVEWVRTQS